MNPETIKFLYEDDYTEWFHPELLKHLKAICEFIVYFHENKFLIPNIDDLPQDQLEALDWFYGLPRYVNNQAVSIPLFSEKLCDALIEYATIKNEDFKPAEHDEEEYKIPEVVLQEHDPELYERVLDFARNTLFMLCYLHWGKYPNYVDSIQLAQFKMNKIRTTNWHHDGLSEMTCLVSLDPSLFTGGGTDIRTSIFTEEHIPPEPKGHVLIFNGRMTLHKSHPIESGVRNILVFWLNGGFTERPKEIV